MSVRFDLDDLIKKPVQVDTPPAVKEKLANSVLGDSCTPLKSQLVGQCSQLLKGAMVEKMPVFDMAAQSKVAVRDFSLPKPALDISLPKPALDFSLPKPALDISKLLSPLESAANGITESQRVLERQYREFLVNAFKWHNHPESSERQLGTLPPNWSELEVDDFSILENLLLDEGLALAWVPNSVVLKRLIKAEDQKARREILDDEWESLAHNCQSVLESVSSVKYEESRKFAIDIVKALLSGHASASQALAANLLDTLLCRELTYKGKGEKMNRDKRPLSQNLQAKENMVYGGIWGSFKRYQIDRGDEIPREFSRHASAHGVSCQQYTRVNAVIALMHVTAYLCWLDAKCE